jgi:hypothetical protein
MSLLDGIAIPEQAFWILCGLFYLADNLVWLRDGEIVLAETLGGACLPLFPVRGFALRGWRPALTNPLAPWLAAARLRAPPHAAARRPGPADAARRLAVARRPLAGLRLLSVTLALAYLVGGPLLTHYRGLETALAALAPLHLLAVAQLAVLMVANRRAWRIEGSRIAALSFEALVCPGLLPNSCRRVALRGLALPGDGVELALRFGGPAALAVVERELEPWLDEADDAEAGPGGARRSRYQKLLQEARAR